MSEPVRNVSSAASAPLPERPQSSRALSSETGRGRFAPSGRSTRLNRTPQNNPGRSRGPVHPDLIRLDDRIGDQPGERTLAVRKPRRDRRTAPACSRLETGSGDRNHAAGRISVIAGLVSSKTKARRKASTYRLANDRRQDIRCTGKVTGSGIGGRLTGFCGCPSDGKGVQQLLRHDCLQHSWPTL